MPPLQKSCRRPLLLSRSQRTSKTKNKQNDLGYFSYHLKRKQSCGRCVAFISPRERGRKQAWRCRKSFGSRWRFTLASRALPCDLLRILFLRQRSRPASALLARGLTREYLLLMREGALFAIGSCLTKSRTFRKTLNSCRWVRSRS